jgi:small subunit ribosomal protein S7e
MRRAPFSPHEPTVHATICHPWLFPCFLTRLLDLRLLSLMQEPDEFEASVAQELLNLEMTSPELKASLRDLYITAAKEVDCGAGGKAIVLYVPYKLRKLFNKVHQRLVRELEKKFSGRHVLIIAQRTILGTAYLRSQKTQGPRPRSRTLTAVHEAILDDIVYPTEIVGKRTRVKVDGKRIMKVYLDNKDQANVEGRTDTFAAVYGKLTNKNVTFIFE